MLVGGRTAHYDFDAIALLRVSGDISHAA